jgi:DNA invertase Pin-like site-specific DNA recombinase
LIAYTRTSTLNGAGQDSLEAQADACREWAAANGHEVVAVHRDEALSGSLPVERRPGLLAALDALQQGEADGLIVHRIDRLARELHVQEAALSQAWGASEHVEVIEAVDGPIKRDDPDDPMRTFVRQVMGASAQLERGLVRARLQGGRRRKAAAGGWVGGHRLHRRYGYEVVDAAYVPVEAEQAVINCMATMRSEGATYRAIAAALNAEGVRPPAGSEWYPATVRKVLVRE